MVDKPGRGSDQFPLRLPDGMRDRLKGDAALQGRSMNAEIVARLEASYRPQDRLAEKMKLLGDSGVVPVAPFADDGVDPAALNETLQDILVRLFMLDRKVDAIAQNDGVQHPPKDEQP